MVYLLHLKCRFKEVAISRFTPLWTEIQTTIWYVPLLRSILTPTLSCALAGGIARSVNSTGQTSKSQRHIFDRRTFDQFVEHRTTETTSSFSPPAHVWPGKALHIAHSANLLYLPDGGFPHITGEGFKMTSPPSRLLRLILGSPARLLVAGSLGGD